MFKTVAILGIGNMGRAIAEGIGRSPDMKNADIILYNPHAHKAEVVAATVPVLRLHPGKLYNKRI